MGLEAPQLPYLAATTPVLPGTATKTHMKLSRLWGLHSRGETNSFLCPARVFRVAVSPESNSFSAVSHLSSTSSSAPNPATSLLPLCPSSNSCDLPASSPQSFASTSSEVAVFPSLVPLCGPLWPLILTWLRPEPPPPPPSLSNLFTLLPKPPGPAISVSIGPRRLTPPPPLLPPWRPDRRDERRDPRLAVGLRRAGGGGPPRCPRGPRPPAPLHLVHAPLLGHPEAVHRRGEEGALSQPRRPPCKGSSLNRTGHVCASCQSLQP